MADYKDLIQKRRQACLDDPAVFAETVWKDAGGSRLRNSHVHRLMLAKLEEARVSKVPMLVAAPRGIGKSEQGMAFLLRILNLDPTIRASIVCDKGDHAAERVSAIARYISGDADQKRLFPEVKIGRNQRAMSFRTTKNRYAKDASIQGGGIISSGVGNRSDVIFFDDVVTEKNAVLEPANILRVKNGFKGTWLPTLEPKIGWWYYICTFYSADDLSHELMNNPDVAYLHISVSAEFDAYDVREYWPGRGEAKYQIPLWEGKWDEEAYRARYNLLVSGGEAVKWYTGYRNMVIDPKTATFRKPWFNRTVPTPEWDKWRHVVMYADPASSTKTGADYYAGVVLGWDPRRKAAVVLHKWKVREGLGDRVKRYLDVWQAFTPVDDAVEGRHELSFREEIRRVAAERGIPVKARPINHGADSQKVPRISGLAGPIEVGKIIFDGQQHPEFWDEAALFPRGQNDDLLDALEGAWGLLKKRLWKTNRVPGTFDPDAPFANERARFARYRVPLRENADDPYRTTRARDLLWE